AGGERHRLARGAGRAPDRPHHLPHGPPSRAQARLRHAARPPEARGPAAASAPLPREQGRGSLPHPHPASRAAPLAQPVLFLAPFVGSCSSDAGRSNTSPSPEFRGAPPTPIQRQIPPT